MFFDQIKREVKTGVLIAEMYPTMSKEIWDVASTSYKTNVIYDTPDYSISLYINFLAHKPQSCQPTEVVNNSSTLTARREL